MITIQQISKYLNVDITTGIVTWKYHDQRPDLVGRECGNLNQGYRRMRLCGYGFYRYQLIWFVAYGEWPTFTIDHVDTDMLNDGIDNLRRATKAQNAVNSTMNVRNTSGYKGVSWAAGKWRADIQIDGVGYYLGRFDNAEDAHEAWRTAAIEAFGEEFVRANG